VTTEERSRGPLEHSGTAVLDKGTRVGKYEIGRLIGVGSMGAVYEAVRTETGERFAIKVLSPALAAVLPARMRFLKEARLTARVGHAHIVDVRDVGEDGGQCYFVMALLEGEDLARRLQLAGPLSAEETVEIMMPVCGAVAEAHRRGITHRDLKPSNIFLTIRDGRPHPVVLDFGIAKDEDGEGAGAAADAVPPSKAVFGTPYYLAPEQVADHRAAGPASDQYALGVILYECLTGHPPHGGESLEEVFRAIVAGAPAPPSTVRPDLPRDIDAVVLRALHPDPKQRFASVAALGEALTPFASKATGAARPPYRRTPSSPAIEVEASTPSPFVRTLTPEVQTIGGSWFDAPEPAEEISGELALSSLEGEPTSDPEPLPSAEGWVDLEIGANGTGKRAPKRIWVGAAVGVASLCLALGLVMTRGGSSARRRPQGQVTPMAGALVQTEPAPPKPSPQTVVVTPVAEQPPAAPTAVSAVVEAPATEPTSQTPTAVVAPTSVPREEPPVAAAPTPPPSGDPPAPELSRARKSVDRPRARASAGIRMHNGVPLLD